MQAARGTPLNAQQRRRGLVLFAVVTLIGVVIDQATKSWAVARLQGEDPIEVIPGILNFTFVLNPGAAFGMATGWTWVLSIIAIGITIFVLVIARRLDDRVWALGLGLLLTGALGNLFDRFFREPGPLRGHVVDFLQLAFIDFPVFNVADSAITVGAAIIIVQSLRGIDVNGERETKAQSDD